jgi:hypothetical protein
VAAFDIGAQAERIRRTGRGLLLPLALSASGINGALLSAGSRPPVLARNDRVEANSAVTGGLPSSLPRQRAPSLSPRD